MMFPFAILCGGLATRLRPITEKIPKALVEIAGEPFIAHQLKLLKRNDIEKVVLCVAYCGEMIREVIGDGSKFGLQINYSFDGEVLLGTGGSLKKAIYLLGDSFFVLYGDSYLDCDYRSVQTAFERSGKSALMTVFLNENRWDKSNVLFVNGSIVSYDKKNLKPEMEHIDYGLGIFKSKVFKTVSENTAYDLADIYKNLAHNGDLAGYEVAQRFYEIGSKEGLEETIKYMEEKE